ncbi:hypothetical protein [Fibrella aquatilis]|uniref:Uncharacterized protein n=1 Tax=Fibrella aquatilis TaxID=2817059 RepID=A0A939G2S2_9BACT|nr:hypothetical protein [Fibrella aquatilis]MBO0930020.1 hypothetical protein [Fibrella aquatilis]
MTTSELIAQIQAVDTPEAMAKVDALIRSQPGKMAPAVQEALLAKLAEVTQQSKELRANIREVLMLNGVEYPLTDWLTPAAYARRFGLPNVSTVTNWISRGVIPAEHIREVPSLGLRLIKAVAHAARQYERAA